MADVRQRASSGSLLQSSGVGLLISILPPWKQIPGLSPGHTASKISWGPGQGLFSTLYPLSFMILYNFCSLLLLSLNQNIPLEVEEKQTNPGIRLVIGFLLATLSSITEIFDISSFLSFYST